MQRIEQCANCGERERVMCGQWINARGSGCVCLHCGASFGKNGLSHVVVEPSPELEPEAVAVVVVEKRMPERLCGGCWVRGRNVCDCEECRMALRHKNERWERDRAAD